MSKYYENYTGCEKSEKTPKCPRCGDMFYHPITMIEDYRQRAAEWEDVANRYKLAAEKHRDLAAMRLAVIQDIDALLRKSEERVAEFERALELYAGPFTIVYRGDETGRIYVWDDGACARKALGRSGK